MRSRCRSVLFLAALASAPAAANAQQQATYDLVVANGRVMDPATGLDAIRHLGIRSGRIVRISATPLAGTRTIDAKSHIVAPGFIDLHEHGQDSGSYAMMVRDGVTSAFELEAGTADVAWWYKAHEGGQLVNYGVAVGHIPARMRVLGDPSTGILPSGIGGTGHATEAQVQEMEAILRRGLAEGAIAVGAGSAYTPGAPMTEITRMFRVAAEGKASVHIHMRGGVAGLDSTLAAARVAGAALHIVHVNSSAGSELTTFLEHITAARTAGRDVTTEAYPYGAGMTSIQSALYDDWASWPDSTYKQYQLVSTGSGSRARASARRARPAGRSSAIRAPSRRRPMPLRVRSR